MIEHLPFWSALKCVIYGKLPQNITARQGEHFSSEGGTNESAMFTVSDPGSPRTIPRWRAARKKANKRQEVSYAVLWNDGQLIALDTRKLYHSVLDCLAGYVTPTPHICSYLRQKVLSHSLHWLLPLPRCPRI